MADARFIEFLDEQIQFYMSLNSYGTGIVDIPLELIEKVAGSASEFELDEDTVSQGYSYPFSCIHFSCDIVIA